jgi:hypothetical protein
MRVVYVLWHSYEDPPGREEDKLIGIYSSRQLAEDALARVRDKPGFRDYPDGFLIDEMTLDRDSWVQGFATII